MSLVLFLAPVEAGLHLFFNSYPWIQDEIIPSVRGSSQPIPLARFRQVLTTLGDLRLVLDQLFEVFLLDVGRAWSEFWHAINRVRDEIIAGEII